jgi:LuxR family maltose regulon positive regulatory protein
VSGQLLTSKITVPRQRHGVVARTRLTDRLNRASESTLTLVSAPAGFGKTTLLTAWLADQEGAERAVAWLSLDPRDNDFTQFWTYLISAIRVALPDLGEDALTLLQPPQSPTDVVVSSLLNDLHTTPKELILVLDDYHFIESKDVNEAMTFLVEQLPAHVHVVIASRSDPALPLPSLRARRELLEFRATDLRFTSDEASSYLTDEMGLTLTSHDVAALEERTEGWIAALQMAALSMQGRDDVTAFIESFAGDDRYIVDYLADEVLRRQPEQVRNFLLQTSILDRLAGPLCDAVTRQSGGKATLTKLERGNLFLVALDDRREWYRYHHLFADVLRAHLIDEQPEDVAGLHRRASAWYADNGDVSEAIRHAISGRDYERAADLVELGLPTMRQTRQEARVYEWLQSLPTDVVRERPVLVVAFAGSMLSVGQLEGVETWLDLADQQLAADIATDATSENRRLPLDDEEWHRLPAMVALYRAAMALSRSDIAGTVLNATKALELAAADHHLSRAAGAGLLGLAYWASGDLDSAATSYSASIAGLHKAGHTSDTLGIAIALGNIRLVQGRLNDALAVYDEALRRAPPKDRMVLRGTADMYVGMADVLLERDDVAAAQQALAHGQELGEHAGLPQNRYRHASTPLREICPPLLPYLTTLSGCTSATSSRTSDRYRRCAPGCK